MQNEQNSGTADVWRAAQHRRTEDLAEWLGHFLKRNDDMPGDGVSQVLLKPHFALARGLTIAIITLVTITSVSAVVDAKRSTHLVLRSTGPMPAVNVP